MATAPPALRTLVQRYDREVFDPARTGARVRLRGASTASWDAVFGQKGPKLVPSERVRADAVLQADQETWQRLAEDLRGGMEAFQAGRLTVRRDLHLGVGFLAATAPDIGPGRLCFRHVKTSVTEISYMEAGDGPPVVMLHGLGATKASFLPTVAALTESHRAIALDLPGFGDSGKPVRAAYDPAFFAKSVLAFLDAMELDQVDLVGNSMGGRAAIEVALRAPERIGRLMLLTPSLAWLRPRPWAAPLRLVPPQLGLIQPAPRQIVEKIVRNVVPGAQENWTAAGVDEFLRSYLSPRGRAAFYAAARNIYLEAPHGSNGFWTRLPTLEPESLFVWGEYDELVPKAFARHVGQALPAARHLTLRCGHVPQLEKPLQTHRAMLAFLNGRRTGRAAPKVAA